MSLNIPDRQRFEKEFDIKNALIIPGINCSRIAFVGNFIVANGAINILSFN